MIDTIPYEPFHAYQILEEGIRENDLWLTQFKDFEIMAKGWKDGGPAYTITIDGEVAACAGLVLLGWSRAEAWTLFSSIFKSNYRACYKIIKSKLEELIELNFLRRVQSLADPEYKEGIRFLEHLGFEKEGLLRKYGPNGEDLIMFGRII
jgi:hypothetical protein